MTDIVGGPPVERPPEPDVIAHRCHDGKLYTYPTLLCSRCKPGQGTNLVAQSGVAERRDPLEPSERAKMWGHHAYLNAGGDSINRVGEAIKAAYSIDLRGAGPQNIEPDDWDALSYECGSLRKRITELEAELGALRAGGPAPDPSWPDKITMLCGQCGASLPVTKGSPTTTGYATVPPAVCPNCGKPPFSALSGGGPAREEPDRPIGIPDVIAVHFPKAWPTDEAHWLNWPQYRWFKDAWNYASTQSLAIRGLSEIHPADLFYVYDALQRRALSSGLPAPEGT